MRLAIPLLFVAGISSPALAIPPPPVTMEAPQAALLGGTATWEVQTVTPGDRVLLLATPTRTGSDVCPPRYAPRCLDLTGPVTVVGDAIADASGHVSFTVPIPSTRERRVFLQAVALWSPTGFYASQVRSTQLLDGALDRDGDGLTNGEELTQHGTSPLLADTDGGGEDDGSELTLGRDPLDAGDDVVGDLPPVITSVAITPANPDPHVPLTCDVAAYDPNGDRIELAYQWIVSGQAWTWETGETLTGASSLDVVQCGVTASAAGVSVGPVWSPEVQLANLPPQIEDITLVPYEPSSAADLWCFATCSDPSGDPCSLTRDWEINGVLLGLDAQTLPAAYTTRGDAIRCRLTADDGIDQTVAWTDSVVVRNSVGAVYEVTVTPSPATVGDVLTCTPTQFSDPDGDPLAFEYRWTRQSDGALLGATSTLDTTGETPGDAVECSMRAFDGFMTSAWVGVWVPLQ